MASVKCGKCDVAIRYHGEPSGIEYIMISKVNWIRMTSKVFDPNNKELCSDGQYPKLYRTDTIETDFPEMLVRYWKCPVCGALHFFDENEKLEKLYVPTSLELQVEKEVFEEGILFDDYKWDDFTENATPLQKLQGKNVTKCSYTLYEKMLLVNEENIKYYFERVI